MKKSKKPAGRFPIRPFRIPDPRTAQSMRAKLAVNQGTIDELERKVQLHDNSLRSFATELGGVINDIKRLDTARLEAGLRDREVGLALGPTWKTAGGLVLRMRDMTDQHLVNAIKFLEEGQAGALRRSSPANDRWLATNQPKLIELKQELVRRSQEMPVVTKGGMRVDLSSVVAGYQKALDDARQDPAGQVSHCPTKWGLVYGEPKGVEEKELSDLRRDIENLKKALDESDEARAKLKLRNENQKDTIVHQRDSIVRQNEELMRLRREVTLRQRTVLREKCQDIVKQLVEATAPPIHWVASNKGWIPTSRAGRAEALVKRLAELLK